MNIKQKSQDFSGCGPGSAVQYTWYRHILVSTTAIDEMSRKGWSGTRPSALTYNRRRGKLLSITTLGISSILHPSKPFSIVKLLHE